MPIDLSGSILTDEVDYASPVARSVIVLAQLEIINEEEE